MTRFNRNSVLRTRDSTKAWVVAGLVLIGSACQPMEPAGVVRGLLVGTDALAEHVSEAQVVLAWYNPVKGMTLVEHTGVSGELPAAFQLPVAQPSGDAYWRSTAYLDTSEDSAEIAFGYIAAVRDLEQAFEYPNIVGLAGDHLLGCLGRSVAA